MGSIPGITFRDLRKSNGIYSFRLRASGTLKFYADLQKTASKDPLFGLWHKHHKLEERVRTYSPKQIQEIEISERTYINILVILGDHKPRTNRDILNHPKLHSFTIGKSRKWIEARTRKLKRMGLIWEAKSTNSRKIWKIPESENSEDLIQIFLKNFHSKR